MPPFSFKKICQWCVRHEASQRGEGDQYQPVITQPWVRRETNFALTQVILGVCVILFVAMAVATYVATDDAEAVVTAVTKGFPGQIRFHFGANFGPDTLTGQWWRLFTYMFLHAEAIHIFFNMWCLWDLGRLCESLYGRWTFASIYVITGIAGGLASIAWNPGVLSVGASGAVFGLAGALISSFYLGEFSLPRVAISGTLRSLIIFAVFNLGFGQFFGGIDNACHIGGLVSGLALGAVIARLAPQSDAPVRRATVVGVVAVAVLAAGLGVREWRGKPMRLARQYEEMQERGDAIGQLQLVLQQQPNLVPAHFALARVYFNQQKYPQAEAEFKKILELEPDSFGARFNLGLTLLNEKRPDDARAAFTPLLSSRANSGDGHYGLGLVLAAQHDFAGAIDEYKKADSDGTQAPGLYYDMGNAYANLKKYDDAIGLYLKQKQESGDDPDVENALADVYEAKGMSKQAQDARSQAEKLKGAGQGLKP
jgi:rhomboid protease GluP